MYNKIANFNKNYNDLKGVDSFCDTFNKYISAFIDLIHSAYYNLNKLKHLFLLKDYSTTTTNIDAIPSVDIEFLNRELNSLRKRFNQIKTKNKNFPKNSNFDEFYKYIENVISIIKIIDSETEKLYVRNII